MYKMYNMIRKQPEAIQEAIENCLNNADKAFNLLKSKRVYLTGCGSSFHAAIYGEFLLRLFGFDAQAIHASDVIYYPPPLKESIAIVISHSWKTRTTTKALEHLANEKVPLIAITASEDAESDVDLVLRTNNYFDESDCVTLGYTTQLTALGLIAEGNSTEKTIRHVPSVVQKSLNTEAEIRKLAEEYSENKRFFVLGAGPNTATAFEAALKMKEGNFSDTEGMQVEQILHGSISGVDQEDVIFIIGPKDAKIRQRIYETAQAMNEIGATTVAVTDGTTEISKACTHQILLDYLPEHLNPIISIIPLQLFAYFLAEENGINPDLTREDDQRYRKAYSTIFLHLK